MRCLLPPLRRSRTRYVASTFLAGGGGEEFAVLLPGASLEAALIVAQRVRTNIEKIALQVATIQQSHAAGVVITASIGVAALRNSKDHIADVMQRADAALYQAKAEGRNRVLSIT
ncbi:GGDEF domain-containing protein [Edaphobacter modestus]|uniref:GGDEF domain-containing protein n=1 Tax=Edaphobacter modestus TaxID=388466 RepID=UPI003BF78C7E